MKYKVRRRYIYYLLKVLFAFISVIPLKLSVRLGEFFGRIAYSFAGKYKRIAISNLAFAFGKEKSPSEIREIAKKVFINFGGVAAEFASFPKINKSNIGDIVVSENIDRIDDALKGGKGAIILGSHFGNWELMACYGAVARGYSLTVIGRRIYYEKYNELIVKLREDKGVKVLYRDDKAIFKKIVRLLNNNEVLGIVPDQDVDSVDGVFVDFFGRPAYTPTGPVVMAMFTGAPILPSFLIRGKRKHHLVIEKPIALEITGNKERDILVNTQAWSRVVESYIRRYPEQWAWIHRRWKTKPEDKPGALNIEKSSSVKFEPSFY